MLDLSEIALLIYVAGIFVTALLAPRMLRRHVDEMASEERDAVKGAAASTTTPNQARRLRETYERLHSRRYGLQHSLELLEERGLGVVAYLVMGITWPYGVLGDLLGRLKWLLYAVWDFLPPQSVECDYCEKIGPKHLTLTKARQQASSVGWVCIAAKDVDVCGTCQPLAAADVERGF